MDANPLIPLILVWIDSGANRRSIAQTRPIPLNYYCKVILKVIKPGYPLSTDLSVISALWQPEMKASALSNALRLSPPHCSVSWSAASSNKPRRLSLTLLSYLIAVDEVALMTSWGCGIPIYANSIPACLEIRWISNLCFIVQKVMQVPALPALAVRPERWIYVSVSFGGSTWMTRSTLGISRPREATSVATSTLNFCSANLFKVTSLCF